jgi:hypothetical protein
MYAGSGRARAALLVASLALVLVGCTPTPSVTPTPTDSTPASATPTATPEPAPLTIPECETLLPIALAHDLFSGNTEFFGEFPPAEFGGLFAGPEATDALAGASDARLCRWGVPNSDGAFSLVVAEISADDRAALEGALTAAGFSVVTMGTVTGFDAESEGMVSSLAATHLFTGNVWIVCDGTTLDLTGSVAGSALDALRTANPTLGL